MFKVVKGQINESYGYQQILFQSKSADDCFNFILARKNSEIPAVRKTSKGMYVIDVFGDVVDQKVLKKSG